MQCPLACIVLRLSSSVINIINELVGVPGVCVDCMLVLDRSYRVD